MACAGFHLRIITLKPPFSPLLVSRYSSTLTDRYMHLRFCSFSALSWTLKGEFRQENARQKLVLQTHHLAGPPTLPKGKCCLQDKLACQVNQAEEKEDKHT